MIDKKTVDNIQLVKDKKGRWYVEDLEQMLNEYDAGKKFRIDDLSSIIDDEKE